MPLRVLEVYATRVKDLSPLAGIRLESLNAQRNPGIELRHLAGMPLADLNIEYCGLSDLGPIRGMPLRRLWLSGNQVASLTPLAGAPLRELVCSNNRITTLAPLAGSSLRQMFCANNPITSLDPFVEKPPAHFYFSSPTIPDAEYRRAQAAWSARPEWAHHARNVEILLALRRNDAAAVRALATEFQGHRYLLVPLVVPWADAEKTARDLGGHLVTFSSAGENAFVRDVAPLYPGVGWIGLADLAGKWCTGEAFTYDNRLPITRAMTAEQAGNRRGSMCASDTRWNSLRADESWPFLVEWEDGK
jgi:Leucine-rich repeat (LRR) protein